MTYIRCGDAIAKLQRCNPDQQVRKGDTHALCRALAVDLSSSQGHRNCDRMHWQGSYQLLEELPPQGLSFRERYVNRRACYEGS
jgi:hypothetical protein